MIVISTFHLVIQHGPVNFKHVDEDGVGVNGRVPFVSGTLVKIGIPSLLHLPKHKKNGKTQFGTWRSRERVATRCDGHSRVETWE